MLNPTASDKKQGTGNEAVHGVHTDTNFLRASSTETESNALVVLYRYSRVTCSTNVFITYLNIQGFPIKPYIHVFAQDIR